MGPSFSFVSISRARRDGFAGEPVNGKDVRIQASSRPRDLNTPLKVARLLEEERVLSMLTRSPKSTSTRDGRFFSTLSLAWLFIGERLEAVVGDTVMLAPSREARGGVAGVMETAARADGSTSTRGKGGRARSSTVDGESAGVSVVTSLESDLRSGPDAPASDPCDVDSLRACSVDDATRDEMAFLEMTRRRGEGGSLFLDGEKAAGSAPDVRASASDCARRTKLRLQGSLRTLTGLAAVRMVSLEGFEVRPMWRAFLGDVLCLRASGRSVAERSR